MQSCVSPRLSAQSNIPPVVKLLPSCRRTLPTHHCPPGGTSSLFGAPLLTMLYMLFMVLAALWPARSLRLSAPSNNPPGVKLLPSCRSTLATHYSLPGGTCSLFGVPRPTHHALRAVMVLGALCFPFFISIISLVEVAPLHCPPLTSHRAYCLPSGAVLA